MKEKRQDAMDGGPDAEVQNHIGPLPDTQSCVIPPAPPVGTLRLVPAFPELPLTRPLWFGSAPGENELHYVVEQGGRILVFPKGEPSAATEFMNLPVYRDNNEEGLLGLAFHPSYGSNGLFYLYYSASGPRRAVLAEYRRDPNEPRRALAQSERILLEIEQPFGNHNGGDLQFGPDGYLYIAVGDGGAAADPFRHGQNKQSLLGTILRIDVDSQDPACGTPYGIPPDNPFFPERCMPGIEPAGAPEVWAWGLRNVWRMSFDRASGELWAGDVGQDAWEEINLIEGGENYGWNPVEGPDCFLVGCDKTLYRPPVHAYGHEQGKSVTGGFVYRGSALPELWGKYIFGDYESGRVWALERQVDATSVDLIAESRQRISSFGEDALGEIYAVSFDGGIMKFERAQQTAPTQEIPKTLSATGCFADVAEHLPAPGVIPYVVNSPLWSDGLKKARFIALPTEQPAKVGDGGRLEFPVGTVLIKTFSTEGPENISQRIETRVIRRGPRRWNGYAYLWRPDQSEADLLATELTVDVGDQMSPQPWTIPSRAQCDHCHLERFGYALGTTIAQLNRQATYGEQAYDQLEALSAAGLLDTEIPQSDRPRLTAPDDTNATTAERTRALLDSNCAMCHQPDGPADTEIDLRVGVPLSEMNLCNVKPQQGELDVPDGHLLRPGDPGHSLLLRRMQIRIKGQMPPLGTHRTDPMGTALVTQWISELTDCTATGTQ